jgi:hypothetical protein
MKNKIHSNTGLVQIPDGNGFLLGFLPTKQLFCLTGLSDDFGDYFTKGEKALIRFNNGKPSQVIDSRINIEEYQYTLKDNEVIVVFGDYFVQTKNFKAE